MDTFMEIIRSLGVVGVWIYLIWLSRTVSNLKSMTDATKNIFDSMKASSDYLEAVHATARSLYDPREIQKIVTAKVEKELLEYDRAAESMRASLEQAQTEVSSLASDKQELALLLATQYEGYRNLAEVYGTDLIALGTFAIWVGLYVSEERIQEAIARLDPGEAKERVEALVDVIRQARCSSTPKGGAR